MRASRVAVVAFSDGVLEAGAPLVEGSLAVRYGTSRTPVREALQRLEQDGLVQRTDRGLHVRTRSPEEILEIYEVRIELEGMAAGQAAERSTPFDLARIRRCADEMTAAPEGDEVTMARTNHAFHQAIWQASHNLTLVDLLDRLHDHLTRYPATTLTSPGRWKAVIAEHRELMALIANRDAAGARALAERHMREAREIRLQMYLDDPSV